MRIEIGCAACVLGTTTSVPPPETLEIGADYTYILECSRAKHRSIVALVNAPYDLLFERGLERLVSGQIRDAVLDGYTALEMFAAEVPARARYDREEGASPKALLEETAPAVRNAERALGAAMALAALVGGVAAPNVPSSITTTRNEAVHKGTRPDVAAAEKLFVQVESFILGVNTALAKQRCVNPLPFARARGAEALDDAIARHGKLPGVTRTVMTTLDQFILAGDTPPVQPLVKLRLAELRSGGPIVTQTQPVA